MKNDFFAVRCDIKMSKCSANNFIDFVAICRGGLAKNQVEGNSSKEFLPFLA